MTNQFLYCFLDSSSDSGGSSCDREESSNAGSKYKSRGHILPPCTSDGVTPQRLEEIEILSCDDESIIDDDEVTDNVSANVEGNTSPQDETYHAEGPSDSPADDSPADDIPPGDTPGDTFRGGMDNNADTFDMFSGFEFLKKTLRKEEFRGPITEKVTCSKGEVLLMALSSPSNFLYQ